LKKGLIGDPVDEENILSVVYIGGPCIDFYQTILSQGEFSFDGNIEAVVGRKSAVVEGAIQQAKLTIFIGIIGVKSILKILELKEALRAGEGKSGTKIPSGINLPV
jgi:hypothetical protein